jgi:predicted nucleotidyltransferase
MSEPDKEKQPALPDGAPSSTGPTFLVPDGTLSPPAMPMRKTFAQLCGMASSASLDEIRAHLRRQHVFGRYREHVEAIRIVLPKYLDPSRIIIFGSVARGDTHEYSDIDTCVVSADSKLATHDQIVQARVALREILGAEGLSIDLVTTSASKYESRKNESGTFWGDVHRDGIRIYP